MKCLKCQAENREGVKFCEQCGAKMESVCPNCGVNIPLGKKFCGDCGHDLAISSPPLPKVISFEEKLDKIQRYLPGGLTEKILSQRGKIEGEHRQVTVMFCDLKGFTPLSEKLGEEKVYSIMDELFEMMIHKVHEYGGTVTRGQVTASWLYSAHPSPWRMLRSGPSVLPWPFSVRWPNSAAR